MRLIIENDGRSIHVYREDERRHASMQRIRRQSGLLPVTFDEVEEKGEVPEMTWLCCKMETGR